ncbi:MAG: DNA methyltransferase [Candidatus Zixiibacteriota bacterium]
MIEPVHIGEDITLYCGDCLEILPTLEDNSIDAVVTDPPYPEISRDYGRMTEQEWFDMMNLVVPEVRRILVSSGSAVFILQANMKKIGSMRSWLWKFMLQWTEQWNMIQDAWWWNHTALPTIHASMHGLLRISVKACVWLGSSDCYRNQSAILWEESDANKADRLSGRCGKSKKPLDRFWTPA